MRAVLLGLVWGMLLACAAVAQDWGNIAVISDTLGNNSNRLCVGDGSRVSDIGCPAYAPFVSATSGFLGIGTNNPSGMIHAVLPPSGGNVLRLERLGVGTVLSQIGGNPTRFALGWMNSGGGMGAGITLISNTGFVGINPSGIGSWAPNAALEVNGTISATNLLINGQPVGGQGDRIISGTSNVLANQDRSVTISTAGVVRMLVGENGNVGVGTSTPSSKFSIVGAGTTSATYTLNVVNSAGTSALFINDARQIGIGTTMPSTTLHIAGNAVPYSDASGGGMLSLSVFSEPRQKLYLGYDASLGANGSGYIQSVRNNVAWTPLVLNASGGNIGIGTTAPSTTLTVMGNTTVSGTVQVAGGVVETCTPGKLGTLRFNPATGAPQICVAL